MTKISLQGGYTSAGNPYPYCIKWRLAKMKYELKVCKILSFRS